MQDFNKAFDLCFSKPVGSHASERRLLAEENEWTPTVLVRLDNQTLARLAAASRGARRMATPELGRRKRMFEVSAAFSKAT